MIGLVGNRYYSTISGSTEVRVHVLSYFIPYFREYGSNVYNVVRKYFRTTLLIPPPVLLSYTQFRTVLSYRLLNFLGGTAKHFFPSWLSSGFRSEISTNHVRFGPCLSACPNFDRARGSDLACVTGVVVLSVGSQLNASWLFTLGRSATCAPVEA